MLGLIAVLLLAALLFGVGFAFKFLWVVAAIGMASGAGYYPAAITATVLWEITRHVLVWYFGTLSQVSVVYGSLTTSIVVLLTFEIGATLLLLGAQVIAEYERIGTKAQSAAPQPLRT